MESKKLTLTCSHCGKQIEVPAELETFSCLYCGEKLCRDELLPRGGNADEADLEYVRAHLFDCIRNYPDYYRNFTRKKYETSFQTHRYGIEETYQAMDRYVCALPTRREELLQSFVDKFLQDWEEFHKRTGKSKAAREKAMFVNKMTLAWYTVPAIRSMELSVSRDYTDLLQHAFAAAYPNNRFEVATYSELESGFRKHGFCFITTAVCEHTGKPDDCAELTAFRAFRDGWLSETAEGRRLIAEYYEIAPILVSAINCCGDRDREYDRIRRESLEPCYAALERGDYDACKTAYSAMVEGLKKKYLLS